MHKQRLAISLWRGTTPLQAQSPHNHHTKILLLLVYKQRTAISLRRGTTPDGGPEHGGRLVYGPLADGLTRLTIATSPSSLGGNVAHGRAHRAAGSVVERRESRVRGRARKAGAAAPAVAAVRGDARRWQGQAVLDGHLVHRRR